MITCPHGHGETDRARCIDRAAASPGGTGCLLCPIPVVLIAEETGDACNRNLAARLPGLISSPWTPPPAVARQTPRTISRGLALSRAVTRYLAKHPAPDAISLTKLLPIHNAIPGALDVPNVYALAKVVRRQSLPLTWRAGRPFLVVSDVLRAFLRGHKEAA